MVKGFKERNGMDLLGSSSSGRTDSRQVLGLRLEGTKPLRDCFSGPGRQR